MLNQTKKTNQKFFLLFVFATLLTLSITNEAQAGSAQSGRGWLWGGSEDAKILATTGVKTDGNETGLGWISMNSINCDTNESLTMDAPGPLGDNPIFSDGPSCPSVGSIIANYGVNIPPGVGDLSGYAWSENVGWISFNAGDLGGCLSGTCSARRLADNTIAGWARIMSLPQAGANAGGWTGWIKLDQVPGISAGLSIDGLNNIVGYAWSGETNADPAPLPQNTTNANGFGYIQSFAKISAPKKLRICKNSCDSGFEATGIQTMNKDDTMDIKACYDDESVVCNSAASLNVTNDPGTSWVANDNPQNAIDLSGTDPKTIKAINAGNTENVSASYLSSTASFTATVASGTLCIFTACSTDENNYCKGVTYYHCATPCQGKKDCTWKEVAP